MDLSTSLYSLSRRHYHEWIPPTLVGDDLIRGIRFFFEQSITKQTPVWWMHQWTILRNHTALVDLADVADVVDVEGADTTACTICSSPRIYFTVVES